MNKLLVGFVIVGIVLVPSFPIVKADEIVLKNGKKIDYGPTWEKDGMVWFYLDDKGVVGISKSSIVDKKGFLGNAEGGKVFVSREYNCEISIPPGWYAANAVEALDVMPLSEKQRSEYKDLEPKDIMKKMGFLALLYQKESWRAGEYNPNIAIKVEDQDMYPGVETPLDYLKNSEFLLKTIYRKFEYSQPPESFVLNNIPSAKQKFSCDMNVNGKSLNITQWQYAFMKNKKIYLVAALNVTQNYKETEPDFLKSMKSFQFIN
jgi:hypothetical protein